MARAHTHTGLNRRTLTVLVCVSFGLGSLAPVGCSKGGSPSTAPADANEMPEVTKVRKAFENATGGLRFAVDDALRIVHSGIASDATTALKKLADTPGLAAEQKEALTGLIEKLKTSAPSPAIR